MSSPIVGRNGGMYTYPVTLDVASVMLVLLGTFGLRKKGPTEPFVHAPDCKIVKADPGVDIKGSEVDAGHSERSACAASGRGTTYSETDADA